MALPLAIPLAAPIAPGAVAAAATFAVGTVAHVAQQVYGFRAPLPPLPRATGRAGEETLQELIADAIAGARVPVALPPSPFGPRGNLVGLAVGALLQLWGQLNSRPPRGIFAPPLPGANPTTGTVPPPGNTVGAPLRIRYNTQRFGSVSNPDCNNYSSSSANSNADFTLQDVTGVSGPTGDPYGCGFRAVFYLVTFADGTEVRRGFAVGTARSYVEWSAGWDFQWQHPTAVPFTNPTADAVPDGYVVPQVKPEPEPAVAPPAPLPLPLPSTVPQVEPSTEPDTLPAPSPLVPITPGPVAPPIVQPATPYSPQPTELPAPTATSNGTLVAPAPVPVPTTPQDAIYPVPDGLPVTGQTIPPTLQAVAQEVGRIEQKIDRMLNPVEGQWGDATDRLQLLWAGLDALVNALTDGAPAGAYQLSSPCVTDEDGVRVVSEVEWTEQGTNHGAILARVDAIAALLQVHKDLKQPNCHIPPVAVGGEFVTVNFEQID